MRDEVSELRALNAELVGALSLLRSHLEKLHVNGPEMLMDSYYWALHDADKALEKAKGEQ